MKKILLTGLLLVMIASISADLIISPNSTSISTTIGQQQNFSLNLTNTFNYTIYNLFFYNLTDFNLTNITQINPNQSIIMPYSVLTTSSYQKIINSKVGFYYTVDLPNQITTYQVNITETGFQPNNIHIRQGDSIIWTNLDEVYHTVTSNLFDSEIQPNQTYSYTFNNLGEVDYQDLDLFWAGTINVINRTSTDYVNDPTLDKIWTININSASNPTVLNFTLIDYNYTYDSTKSNTGVMTIYNTGSSTAERITLSDSLGWIVFDKQSFNLNSNDHNSVTFTIIPMITDSNETGKNYTDIIKLTSANSNESDQNIYINVLYDPNLNNINTDEGFLNAYDRWCKVHPNAPLCTGVINSSGNGNATIRDQSIPANLTATQLYKALRDISALKLTQDRNYNDLKSQFEGIAPTVQQNAITNNQSLQTQLNNQRTANTVWNSLAIIGFFIVLIACICFAVIKIRKRSNNARIIDGQVVKL